MSNNNNQNPYLCPPNPYDEYNDYVKKYLNNSKDLQQRTCKLMYKIFEANKEGKELLAILVNEFLFNTNYQPAPGNSEIAVYYQGTGDVVRYIIKYIRQYKDEKECQKS